MKKHTISLLTLFAIVLFVSCKKDKNDDPPAKTKTQHITASTWKLDGATANNISVINFPQLSCWKDNTGTFVSTSEGSGTGTLDEGLVVCSGEAQTSAFTWNFQTNETILFMSTPIFPTGSSTFNIITLNETNLVVSQMVTLDPAPPQNVIFTFKH